MDWADNDIAADELFLRAEERRAADENANENQGIEDNVHFYVEHFLSS